VDRNLAKPELATDSAEALPGSVQFNNLVPVAYDAWSATNAPVSSSAFEASNRAFAEPYPFPLVIPLSANRR
jgi:hypothetical protein